MYQINKYLLIIVLSCFQAFIFSTYIYGKNLIKQDSIINEDDLNLGLMSAAARGDIKNTISFIQKGANVNSSMDDGFTPLIFAAQAGHSEVCRFLIEKNADVNVRTISGMSPIIGASKNGNARIVELLIKNNANLDIIDDLGRSPLMYAVARNDNEIFNLLIDKGVNINAQDIDGLNILSIAVINENYEMIEAILKKGLDPNSIDKRGVTPIMIATGNGNKQIIDLLLANGANINIKNKANQTALTIAIKNNDNEFVSYIIEKGAEVNQPLSMSETPLTIAKFYNVSELVINTLKEKGAVQNRIPDFRRFNIGLEILFNQNDLMSGLIFGIQELKFNCDLYTGISIRPYQKSILVELNNEYFQLWEKRNMVYFGINKNFDLNHPGKRIKQGVYIGAKPTYSWGSYRAANFFPEDLFIVQPEIGSYIQSENYKISLSFSLLDLDLYKISDYRIGLKAQFFLGSYKRFDLKHYSKWE